MTIPPDTKDWTWVLTEQCPECGYFSGAPGLADLPALAHRIGRSWARLIPTITGAQARPKPVVWSALEYACHVRDVFGLARYRTQLMVDEDDPTFANWDQDATAVEQAYNSQDPVRVGTEIELAAAGFAAYLSPLPPAAWARIGRRSDGAVFSVESFTRYVLHDPVHHLMDVTGSKWPDSITEGPDNART